MLEFPLWKKLLVLVICIGGLFVSGLAIVLDSGAIHSSSSSKFIIAPHVRLGLDLKGGVYLLYRIDMARALDDYMVHIRDSLQDSFRIDRVPYNNLVVQNHVISFVEESDKFDSLIHKIVDNLDHSLIVTSAHSVYQIRLSSRAIAELQHNIMLQSISIIRRRIDFSGTKEPIIQQQGNDCIFIQAPGSSNSNNIKKLIGKTAKLTFHILDTKVTDYMIALGQVPFNDIVMLTNNNTKVAVFRHVEVDGIHLVDAQATFQNGKPVVSFRFDSLGGRQFAETTRNHVGDFLAIALDNVVISIPQINTPILVGSGIIEGNFTLKQTQQLALLLRSGALPAPIHLIEEQVVGPGLGKDSIHSGIVACCVGTISVFLFMLIYYGLFGFFADIALFFNITLLLALLIILKVTLTLPGIAGIVLTVGMSVDANVLSFERIKEEIRFGRSPLLSIESGYIRAWNTIVDSNLTTLVAAFFLFIFGSGPIKGFATTLSIGILTSVFTSIVVTRFMISIWFRRKRPKKIKL